VAPEQTSRVIRILETYLGELERGGRPHPQELAARHPDLAEVLQVYLTKLDLLHSAATGLRGPAEPVLPVPLPERGRLGDFAILREVGRGGMGIVYEAEQISLGRKVALKVLPFAPGLDGRQLQRFKNEARAAAHLHHTHIVPVFGVGSDRGVHYYAMQFIEGQSLAALIGELRRLAGRPPTDQPLSPDALSRPTGGENPDALPPASAGLQAAGGNEDRTPHSRVLSSFPPAALTDTAPQARGTLATWPPVNGPEFFKTVARLGVQAAEALEHAHQLGVVHRDIKPANLLIDGPDHLWVTDFGLARCQGEGGLTLTGALVGTLRYMSPEQALARSGPLDHRTDIYSLGVTLYELLTLEPAYTGRDRNELLRQLAFDEPRAPRRLNPAIPAELETIVLKAMAKEPEGRYASARELADDLRRFLENKPIRARRPTLRERLRKWARRHQPLVLSAAGLLVLAVVGLVTASVLILREQAQTRAALAEVRKQWVLTQAQEAEAQAQRRRAEENFRKACHGVTRLLLRLEEKRWGNLPEINELRQALAEEGVAFFQGFLNEPSSDPAVRREKASAYQVLAGVYALRSAHPQAIRAYHKAIRLFGRLAAQCPHDFNYQHGLALSHNLLGGLLHQLGRVREAREQFDKAVTLYRRSIACRENSRSLNDLAWMMVTCPQLEFRNVAKAIALAERAVAKRPACGEIWNTLGVAHYRAGHWKAAVAALKKSMQLRSGGDSSDWFFLAMAYWRLGHKCRAHRWYERALQEVQKTLLYEPLEPYRDEAKTLLGRKPCACVKDKG
jgi:serine/threonine protein kinase